MRPVQRTLGASSLVVVTAYYSNGCEMRSLGSFAGVCDPA